MIAAPGQSDDIPASRSCIPISTGAEWHRSTASAANERINEPGDLRAALGRDRQAIVARSKPDLIDVRIERFVDGSESE